MNIVTNIASNYAAVTDEVAKAAEQAGRNPDEIRVIGVTKLVNRAAVDEALAAGLRDVGENRVQDALRKFADPLPEAARLHLIGHLQTNKARDAVALFDTIHSVDRSGLVDALARRAARQEKSVDVLIQVNISGEEQKHGCDPDEAAALIRQSQETGYLRVIGLMTIAPLVETAEEIRPVFRGLRELRDRLRDEQDLPNLQDLSMGMTNDYPVAIEEGATMIRVGRAIFGG